MNELTRIQGLAHEEPGPRKVPRPFVHLLLLKQRTAPATNLLRGPAPTIGAIAAQVGFSSTCALSVAVNNVRGTSPSKYRTAEAQIGD